MEMENRKVVFGDGSEIELDADVAAKIEATRAANEGQLLRVRTAIASMPASQRRYAWDAYRLLIRARTDADNAQQLAAVRQVTLNS
jgi:YD repeat-containing protein